MRALLILIVLVLNSCKPKVNKVFPFGIEENGVRAKLKIPIIEDGMIDNKEYLRYAGNSWQIKNKLPEKVGVPLHILKIVTLSKCDTCFIRDETDFYRRTELDGSVSQLNLFTKISSRYKSHRTGRYFKYNDRLFEPIPLDEVAIDSICKSWGLRQLVKGVDSNSKSD